MSSFLRWDGVATMDDVLMTVYKVVKVHGNNIFTSVDAPHAQSVCVYSIGNKTERPAGRGYLAAFSKLDAARSFSRRWLFEVAILACDALVACKNPRKEMKSQPVFWAHHFSLLGGNVDKYSVACEWVIPKRIAKEPSISSDPTSL